MPVRIISGGQTGVDRGALDAAMELGVECGGWCPEGRAAEDGSVPAVYPLRVLPGADYAARTRRNVMDSDATLVIAFSNPGGGTLLTCRCARELGKPLLILDGDETDVELAAGQVREFIRINGIGELNVAGPRASEAPRAYAYSRAVIARALQP